MSALSFASRHRGPWAVLVLAALVSCKGGSPAGELTLEQALGADWSGLEVRIVTAMPEDEKGGTAIVFLHGYGSRGSDYAALAEALAGESTRVVLPTAVLPHPQGRGAMWWEFFDDDWPKPWSDDPPAWQKPSRQLPRAREAVVELIAQIRSRYRPETLAIAGHSQGAMLALDVAARLEPPPDRVALVAGYALLDSGPNIRRPRENPPPTFISHGRGDAVVPFERAVAMRRLLEESGFAVTFRAHDGDHGLDAATARGLREFLLEASP